MLNNATSTLRYNHLNRRRFLKTTGIVTAMTVLGAVPTMHCVYAAALGLFGSGEDVNTFWKLM